MQEKVSNSATNEDAVKVVQEFEEIIRNKKVILYGWSISKVKYFNKVTLKTLKEKNDLLAWF